MASKQSALEALRLRGTVVDCDTMDAEVVRDHSLGVFMDCTSNQAIAYGELQKPAHSALIHESIVLAKRLDHSFPGVTAEELAVEIAMIKLQLLILPHIKGLVHIQVNPFYAYSTQQTLHAAHRIVSIFEHLYPSTAPDHAKLPQFSPTRVCIKIPSTWEGLAACRQLEESGVRTLATTLFTLEQAVLAAEVNCKYVAPYVNELKVHFDSNYHDPAPQLSLCAEIQKYYTTYAHKHRTQVLPASLTSTAEILQLSGVQHITIPPALLRELAKEEAVATASLFDDEEKFQGSEMSFVNSEAAFRMALTRSGGADGRAEMKLVQALNIFCDMQEKLVEMMRVNIQRQTKGPVREGRH